MALQLETTAMFLWDYTFCSSTASKLLHVLFHPLPAFLVIQVGNLLGIITILKCL